MTGHVPKAAEPGLPLYQLVAPVEADSDISFKVGSVAFVLYNNQYVVSAFNTTDSGTVFQLCGLIVCAFDAATSDPGLPAAALPFDREFDAVFSNAAPHWMKDADAVIGRVARALRPGGRCVARVSRQLGSKYRTSP